MRFNFGRRFNLPRIVKSGSSSARPSKQELGNLKFYPGAQGGENHPLPFYQTSAVTLPPFKDPPWKDYVEKEQKEKFKEMIRQPKFARYFADSYLKEFIDQEIAEVASLSIAAAKNQEKLDREAVIYIEKEIFLPVVQREVFICVWELLYEWGRELPQEQFKQMEARKDKLQMSEKSKQILNANMLEGLHWKEDLTDEKKISGERWEVLLYNYRARLQQNTFKRNVALHLLQERIVSQVAADEVMNEGVFSYLDQDVTTLDEKEKTLVPPRIG